MSQAMRTFVVICMCALLVVGCTPSNYAANNSHLASNLTSTKKVENAPKDTVLQLVNFLRQHDLAGFAKAAVPPQDYDVFAQAWAKGASRWPLTELPSSENIVPMLAALSANDAERQLGRKYDLNLASQTIELRNTAEYVGILLSQYVRTQGNFTPAQRAHWGQVIPALSQWAQHAPLADSARAHTALRALVPAARATGIRNEANLVRAGLDGALVKLDPFFATLVSVLADYDLPLDESLDHVQIKGTTVENDIAQVTVSYPLADKIITLTVTLRQQDGHWYVASYMNQAAELRKNFQEQTPMTPEVPPTADKTAGMVSLTGAIQWA